MKKISATYWGVLEGTFWVLGALLISFFWGNRFSQNTQAAESMQNFELEILKKPSVHSDVYPQAQKNSLTFQDFDLADVNTDLWSVKRKSSYEEFLASEPDMPQALLYVEDLQMKVPVFLGASDSNLEKGAGWIKGTAGLNDMGNIGLAAHRDSFFRALKDIRIGQVVRLRTFEKERHFEVANIEVVDPTSVEVLKDGDKNKLTLVTCYPFYHVGKAPKRFIVSAIEVP